MLAGEVQHGTAGHEQRDAWRAREQLAEDRCPSAQVLGGVEHEQQLAPSKHRRQRVQRLLARDFPDRERARDRTGDQGWVTQRRQLHESGAVGKRGRGHAGGLER